MNDMELITQKHT